MRALASHLVVLAVIGLAGCGGKAKSVTGSWVLDTEKMVDEVVAAAKRDAEAHGRTDRLPDEAELRSRAAGRTLGLRIDLELRADGTMTVVAQTPRGSEAVEGRWESKNGEIDVTIATKNGKPASGQDVRPQRLVPRGKHLVILDADGTDMFWMRRR